MLPHSVRTNGEPVEKSKHTEQSHTMKMKSFKTSWIYGFTFIFLLLSESVFSQDFRGEKLNGGDIVGRHIYGLATDYHGDPLLIEDKPLIYDKSDFQAMINIDKALFMVSGFNQQIGGVYVTEVNPKNSQFIDTVALKGDKVGGFSFPTGGFKTSWNTMLMSENGRIDAAKPKKFIDSFRPYFKGKNGLVNPYKYGWVSEVIVLDAQGQAKAIKNYALGRMFANQVLVMPDNKTLYMLDGLGNLYLFVANQEKSLAKGNLYAIDRENGQVNYTLLGKPAALKVKFKLKKASFKSIFKTAVPDISASNKNRCEKRFKYINTIYGEECLQVKKKYKKYAAFFEPVRVMAMKGISSFTAENSRMKFNSDKNEMTFTVFKETVKNLSEGQAEIRLALGNNANINSKYVIKDSK